MSAWGSASPCSSSATCSVTSNDAAGGAGMRHDLLPTGGHPGHPAPGVDGRRDIAFASGGVWAIDGAIPRESAREVVDVSGAYVAPGLVDLHAHAFIAGHDLGIETDPVCASTGVTTLCDAGSTGGANFAGLREYVMARAETRVLGFVHIAAIGLSHLAIGEHCYLDYSDRDLAAGVAREHRDVVVGVKVRIPMEGVAQHGLVPVRRGGRATGGAGWRWLRPCKTAAGRVRGRARAASARRHREPLLARPRLGDFR